MDIPQELKDEIERISINQHSKIIEESKSISKKYRENDGKGKKLVTKKTEALAYAISRMPATYCAVYSVLSQCLKKYKQNINLSQIGKSLSICKKGFSFRRKYCKLFSRRYAKRREYICTNRN